MSRPDDIYTIPDEDVLESLKRNVAGMSGIRNLSGSADRSRTETRRPSAYVAMSTPRRPRASSFVAASLSILVCGAGQAYNRQAKLGAMLFLLAAFTAAGQWALFSMWPVALDLGQNLGFGESALLMLVAGLSALLVALALASVFQAYRRADSEHGPFEGFDHPILSGLASLLLPGYGQILNAQIGKAMVFLFFLFAPAVAAALIRFSPLPMILGAANPWDLLTGEIAAPALAALGLVAIMWILSVYDACLVASLRRRSR